MYERHGDIDTPLYNRWRLMKHRCKAHPAYTKREVCEEWRTNYLVFKEWALTNGYSEGLTLDRIDNYGGYSPTNCRWLSLSDNASRPRKVSEEDKEDILELLTKGVTQQVIADTYNVSQATISRFKLEGR